MARTVLFLPYDWRWDKPQELSVWSRYRLGWPPWKHSRAYTVGNWMPSLTPCRTLLSFSTASASWCGPTGRPLI